MLRWPERTTFVSDIFAPCHAVADSLPLCASQRQARMRGGQTVPGKGRVNTGDGGCGSHLREVLGADGGGHCPLILKSLLFGFFFRTFIWTFLMTFYVYNEVA